MGRRRRRSRLLAAAIGPLLLLVAACGTPKTAPNLDAAVPGVPVPSLRELIAGHQDWRDRLSATDIDELARFLHDSAGAAPGRIGSRAGAGLTLWRSNGCGSCHALAAGAGG